jgi:hypothetical protein
MKSVILFFAALLTTTLMTMTVSAQSFDHSHAAFSVLLKKHVVLVEGGKTSKVNYVEFGKDQAALKSYLDSLSKVSEAEFNGWTKPNGIFNQCV